MILSLVLVASVTFAQGVAFEPDGTLLPQAAAKAKKENKLVFVDCYTQWCGPCKKMARDIFPQEKVGKFMNERFVNVKIDMEASSTMVRATSYTAMPMMAAEWPKRYGALPTKARRSPACV